jgi:hypothetical protein
MNESSVKLDKYKSYLNQRYSTFMYVFNYFERENTNNKIIIELGTTRSFVSGGYEGCMSTDSKYWNPNDPSKWDWGAGCFTRICMECLDHLDFIFHTVDICDKAIHISKTITKEYSNRINYHCESSLDFLDSFNGMADIIYMDAGETGEDGALLHLDEAKLIIKNNLLKINGLILIDDINLPNSQESKGKYSIPYLIENGFDILLNGYQVILQRNKL